jgi:hypothetical protein
VETLVAHGTDVMEEAVTAMRAALPPGTRVLFIIEGAAEYIGRRMKAADAARRRGAVPPPTVTQDGYDAANMHLYVTVELEAKETVRGVAGGVVVCCAGGMCRSVGSPKAAVRGALGVLRLGVGV